MSQAAIVIKDQELAELRHNLRTPVNHIVGYGEMLLEDAEEAGSEDFARALHRLIDGSKTILAVINSGLAATLGEVAEAQIMVLRSALLEAGSIIRGHARKAEQALVSGQGDSRALADLHKVQGAIERLIAMAEALGSAEGPAEAAAAPAAEPEPPPAQMASVAPITVVPPPAVLKEAASAPAPAAIPAHGHLLIVDDIESNRDVLGRRLEREGYSVAAAADGYQALEMLREGGFDLALLDIMMPGIDGFEVLQRMKACPILREIPVIMISALDEIKSVVRCLESGAEDYLTKPFDPVLLRARIGASLERKRLRDEQKAKTNQLERAMEQAEAQRQISESLLRNILPVPVAEELQAKGSVDPKYFEDVSILFTDFVGFTVATENLAAEDLVNVLHQYFSAFDEIVTRYGLEKLKTIGDSYMLAGGLPVRSPSHPVDAVLAAFEMVRVVEQLATEEMKWSVRIGVHTGPVIAGMVGTKKFAFDIWGESVNFASRMEAASQPGRINVSSRTHSRIKDFFACEARGPVKTKEGKEYEMYFVNGILPKLKDDDETKCPPPAFLRRYRIYFQKEPPAFPGFLLRG